MRPKSKTPSRKASQNFSNTFQTNYKQSNSSCAFKQGEEKSENTKILNKNPKSILQQQQLVKKLFQLKCQGLKIPLNKQKYKSFLSNFTKKNPHRASLNLSDMNLTNCQSIINKLMLFSTKSLNLSKSLIKPALINLQNIQKLSLVNCNLDTCELEKLFDILIKFQKVKYLNLSSDDLNNRNQLGRYEKLYEFIKLSKCLTELYLANIGIKKDTKIFFYLKGSFVKKLDLSKNEGVIGMSPSLEYINLSGNQIVQPESLFTHDLKIKNQLKELNISLNPIPYYLLQKFLKPHFLAHLQILNLNKISITEECLCIQQFLSHSLTIRIVEMVDCKLNESSWANVILGLRSSRQLSQINLSKNIIPNEDIAGELGEIFTSVNCHIRILKLALCGIKDKFGPQLLKYLHKNKYLTELDLSGNNLANKSASCLLKQLKNNYQLKMLNISQNSINYGALKDIKQYIDRNRFLQYDNMTKQFENLKKQPGFNANQNHIFNNSSYMKQKSPQNKRSSHSSIEKDFKIFDKQYKLLQDLHIVQAKLTQLKEEKNELQCKIIQTKLSKINEQTSQIKSAIKSFTELESTLAHQCELLETQILELSQSDSQLANLGNDRMNTQDNPEEQMRRTTEDDEDHRKGKSKHKKTKTKK